MELCVASILNHSVPEERPIPGLQNHEEKPPAGPENQGEAGGEAGEPAKASDSVEETTLHNTLVAHVGGLVALRLSVYVQ